jgi:hypothetical protein
MDVVRVQEAMQQSWQEQWPALARQFEQEVSGPAARAVMQQLMSFFRSLCTEAFRTWLMSGNGSEPQVERDGQRYRFKKSEAKEFLTLCGPVRVERRLYQADRGGPTVAPLDEAWGMVGEFATPEVRDVGAYLMGLVTSAEAADILRKLALFSPAATSLKKFAEQFGHWLAEHPDAVATVRSAEAIPAETRVLSASLDGTNVRLAEPGPKPGRPGAGDDGVAAPTCFKNAMVGTVTCYGDVPANATRPPRLQSKYVARMPEEGSPTFRRAFEEEVADTLSRCEASVAKVLVLDGAKALWHYVTSQPLFADFEKILDFCHVSEHLSTLSEALFGKGSDKAKQWSEKHRDTLRHHDDGALRVIRAIDSACRGRRLPGWARKEIATQREFFRNHQNRMNYASFRRRGLPIGSGPVEAAGKMLVKHRLGRNGMRWSRSGGQHILDIRTLIKSGRWNDVWNRHCNSALAA